MTEHDIIHSPHTPERISRDDLYMRIAWLFSLRGTCKRLQVGAVITKDGRIICSGYNGPAKDQGHCGPDIGCDMSKPCTHAIHAEANAIAYAARNGIALEGTTIYVTASPCIKCAELIVSAGIKVVKMGSEFRDSTGVAFLQSCGIIPTLHEVSL